MITLFPKQIKWRGTEQKSMFADKKANKQFQNKLGDKMKNMNDNLRCLEVSFIGPTSSRGDRVKIYDHRFKKTKVISWDYAKSDSTLDQAKEYLKEIGIKPLHTAEGGKGYFVMTDDFNIQITGERKKSKAKSTMSDDVPATLEKASGLEKPDCDRNTKPDITVPEEKATIADKKPKRKYTKRKKATMDDGNIFSAIKKAWNKDPIVKWLKK